jgi:tetratricopeptide (TPR) repeat protein
MMRYALGGLMALMLMAGGCISDQQKISDAVSAGEVALGGNRFDVAVSDADDALHIGQSAQAYYLRGRAEESRPKPDDQITAGDLASARVDYQSALDLHPGQPLEARCHAGLANVAFVQDDYATALYQYTSAVDHLDRPEWQELALYRIGECQQRLGHFQDADRTFALVCQQYAGDDIAAKAEARESVHGFYVQIGAYAQPNDATTAMKSAQTDGLDCRLIADQGMIAVRGGPFSTYTDALHARAAVAAQFPDAAIGP